MYFIGTVTCPMSIAVLQLGSAYVAITSATICKAVYFDSHNYCANFLWLACEEAGQGNTYIRKSIFKVIQKFISKYEVTESQKYKIIHCGV